MPSPEEGLYLCWLPEEVAKSENCITERNKEKCEPPGSSKRQGDWGDEALCPLETRREEWFVAQFKTTGV